MGSARFADLVRATRPGFLRVTALGCLLAIVVALACSSGARPLDAVATVGLALLAHASANVYNDWADDRLGAIVAVGGGLVLAARAGPGLVAIGLAGAVLGRAYSSPRGRAAAVSGPAPGARQLGYAPGMTEPSVVGVRYKIPESVLVVIHTRDREVLLIERADKPGAWQSVTGARASADEPFEETAIREVGEETGIRVGSPEVPRSRLRDWQLRNVYEIFPVWAHRYAPGVTHNTEHVFGLTVPRDIAIVLSPREHLNHRWLPWREAADACFSFSNAEAILQLPRFL